MPNRILHVLRVLEVLEIGPERALKTNQILLNIMKMMNYLSRYRFSKESVMCFLMNDGFVGSVVECLKALRF